MLITCGELQKYSRLEWELPPGTDFLKIVRPDGKVDIAESFVFQPIEVSYDAEGIEHTHCCTEASLRCRYTPDFAGKAVIEAYSGNQVVAAEEITITDSDSHGYIEVSKKDKKYFAYSDGTPFFSIGINLAFPTSYGKSDGKEFGLKNTYRFLGLRQYERWFQKLSANGANVARVWVGHEYFNPDLENINEFDYAQFTKIDMLLALAKKYGMKLKLTLEQFRFFDYERKADSNSYSDDVFRKFNKRLYDGEQRCESFHEWLNEDRWQKAWLTKVSEFAKRYSGDTEIFAIELWNEMSAVGSEMPEIVEWNQKILPKVKEMFPQNFVINSFGSLDSEGTRKAYQDFCWEKSDFVQIHRYLDQGAAYEDCHKDPIEMITGAFQKMHTDRAVYIAETGAVNNCHSGPFKFYVNDDNGILFADTVYTPVFCKSCGIGNIWHWDERYVEAKNLYPMLQPIRDLVSETVFDEEEFEPLDLSTKDISLLLLKGKTEILGYIRNKRYNWETVLRDLEKVQPVSEFDLELEGAADVQAFPVWKDDRTNITLQGNMVHFTNIDIGTLFKIKM